MMGTVFSLPRPYLRCSFMDGRYACLPTGAAEGADATVLRQHVKALLAKAAASSASFRAMLAALSGGTGEFDVLSVMMARRSS